MKYQIVLIPVAPFSDIDFDIEKPAALSIQIIGPDNIEVNLALITDAFNKPNAIRIMLVGEKEEYNDQKWESFINTISQHMLTCLKIGYRNDVYLLPGQFVIEVESPSSIEIEPIRLTNFDNIAFLPKHVQEVFSECYENKEEMRLYVEGGDQRMPLHYRFMSYYKILELHFKNGKNKFTESFEQFTQKYSEDFKNVGFNRLAHKCIHDLRDNCAHIIMNKGKGISALNHLDTERLENALTIMNDICRELLMQKMPNIILKKPSRFGDIQSAQPKIK